MRLGWTDWYIAANLPDLSSGGRALAADPRYTTEGTGHQLNGIPTQYAGSAVAWDSGLRIGPAPTLWG